MQFPSPICLTARSSSRHFLQGRAPGCKVPAHLQKESLPIPDAPQAQLQARASCLGEIQGVMRLPFAPVMPSFSADMLLHAAVQQHGFCKISPWTAQINAPWRTVACKMAALKYIAIFLSLRSRCRGHISVDLPADILGIQLTVFKICRGASKNKINISLIKQSL